MNIKCCACKQDKPCEAFSRSSDSTTGRQGMCKACYSEYQKRYERPRPPKIYACRCGTKSTDRVGWYSPRLCSKACVSNKPHKVYRRGPCKLCGVLCNGLKGYCFECSNKIRGNPELEAIHGYRRAGPSLTHACSVCGKLLAIRSGPVCFKCRTREKSKKAKLIRSERLRVQKERKAELKRLLREEARINRDKIAADRLARRTRICEQCGKTYVLPRVPRPNRPSPKFCSQACNGAFYAGPYYNKQTPKFKPSGLCVYCGQQATQWDHYIAVSKGGPNRWDNFVPACAKCNQRKRDKPAEAVFGKKSAKYAESRRGKADLFMLAHMTDGQKRNRSRTGKYWI